MSVLVYTENWEGKFKKLSYELVSYAKNVAALAGGDVTALSIGSVDQDELSSLGNYGASLVLSADVATSGLDNQVYTSIIAAAMEKCGAKILVLAHNNTGKALAPRLSVRLKAGLAAAVTAVPESADPLVVRKKVFSGKAFGQVEILTLETLSPMTSILVQIPLPQWYQIIKQQHTMIPVILIVLPRTIGTSLLGIIKASAP